jgi:RNA polymerase primary sigma factor
MMRGLKIGKHMTPRDSKSLDKYLTDISKVPMIDAKEEAQLARRIQSGDQAALDILIKANLRFVVSVAKQYIQTNQDLGDLINQGNEGLIKAAKRFDESRGFKFISYAVWWIRQNILEYLGEQSRIVRVPLNKISQGSQIEKTRIKLEQKLQRPVQLDELSEELGMDVNKILLAQKAYTSNHLSLDEIIQEEMDEGDSYLDRLVSNEPSPDSSLSGESIKIQISKSISSTLLHKEREVLVMYFGLEGNIPHTLEDIAEKVGLTRERVRQIKEKSLRKLRKSEHGKILKSYLG